MEFRSQEEAEVAGVYSDTLAGLTENSLPEIRTLTKLARDNGHHGEIIVKVIKQRLMKASIFFFVKIQRHPNNK